MAANDELVIRRAHKDDLAAIVAMLADDPLGATRESPGDPAYADAFDRVDGDSGQLLVVADLAGEVVGTLQLSFIPGLSRLGMTRALVEAVRVRSDQRGSGLGSALLRWAVTQARQRGCGVVQLTTDARRVDAHRFYEQLGFQASHVGMKLVLD